MLVHLIQGCLCAYVQSDEISLLLTDYRRFNTDYNLQKIVSVSAAMATAYFNEYYDSDRIAFFDSRAFNLPREEVNNYFVWRQKDWIRNSVQMMGQAHFSHRELQNKSCSDIHEMLHSKGLNWAHLPSRWKNGSFITKGCKDCQHMFQQCPQVIENLLQQEEE